MRKRQKEILNEVAYKHGISIAQAEEIWKLFTDKVALEISNNDKNVKGKLDEDKFKTIHIQNFGKFIPNKRKIHFANLRKKEKKE